MEVSKELERPLDRRFKTIKAAKEHIVKNSVRVGNELHLKKGISVFNQITLLEH